MSSPKALGKIQGDWDFAPGQASYSEVSYRYNIFFVVIMVVLILIIVIATTSSGGKKTQDAAYFRDTINNSAELPLLRPIVVSVFERAVSQIAEGDPASGISTPGELDTVSVVAYPNLSDQDRYNERLIVVRPNNWLIYTNNGVTFHYVTSNVSDNRLNCTTSGSLSAVEYRLKKVNELVSVNDNLDDDDSDQPSRTLRFSCINYTFDQLTRVFTQSSNRTDIDMTDYFDKKSRPSAPDFTVANVLQFLVTNEYL